MEDKKNKTGSKIGRRDFLKGACITATGIALGSEMLKCSKNKISQYDIMKENMKYRKIDAHVHVQLYGRPAEENIGFADRLGIDKMIISRPITQEKSTPEEFRKSNDMMIDAVKKYPDRFIGQCFIDPTYQKESLEEIDRCVDAGMVGLKVYTQVKINDPLYYPIVEKCIKLKMIMLMHSFCQLGLGGYRMKYDIGILPNTSIPEDFVDIASRYPEGMFQYAHIGGGSDWEYACKLLKDSKNVWFDTSGSNNEEYMIDFAVKTVGEDRLFFGTDNSYYQSIGKVFASNLNETQKKKLFFDNYNNILRKAGRDVN